jgi:hypothetical protein
MSNADSLTRQEAEAAASMGWGLYDVYDADRRTVSTMVLPTPFGEGKSAKKALEVVSVMAQRGHALCQKAVRIVAQSNMQGAKK